ncbi:MAG: GWxTD domain-containing protein [Candidatus Saccharicenans sp.]|jgi:GWxTD domain-containing protein|nr:GWxTD domain-containing protein [Candidatus Saccharicenans sp.]MDH7493624.1 GWxTD domain-containing protein [Candidatus Saccharicenans sp.]
MSKRLVVIVSLLFFSLSLVSALTSPSQSRPKSQKDLIRALPDKYRKWLEEEVVYISSEKEKDVFLRLENDRQRDIFIEAFWKQRDPNPNTPENEFKEEHYRRLQYANQHFGKESPGPGWRSDMGKIYIMLGEPKSIEKFENLYDLYPTIIWFYQGMAEYGLPNAFSVVFYKPDGTGEYKLYSPIKDGPMKLMPHYSGDMTSYAVAFGKLADIEPNVAKVSLSLIEGEPLTDLVPSISSDVLLNQKIPAAPTYKVRSTYAEKLFRYQDIIEVEYTANYIDSDALVSVYQSPGGIYYVHYLIEPKKLSLERNDNNYQTTIVINGIVTDTNNQQVYQFDRRIPLNLRGDQVSSIRNRQMSFQDVFPLVPGKYRLSILFKNFVSKEFTSLETTLNIPERQLQMSPVLLSTRLSRSSQYRGLNKAFLLNDLQFMPTPRNDFVLGDRMYAFFQVWGLTPELRNQGSLNYEVVRENGEVIKAFSKKLSEYTEGNVFYEEFVLEGWTPANYTLRVNLQDGNNNVLLTEKTNFFISHLPTIPRSWVMTQPVDGDNSATVQYALGLQYWNKKDTARARRYLETAHKKDPTNPALALDYCRLLFSENQFQEVLNTALLFINQGQQEFLEIVGQAFQAQQQYQQAINYYQQYLAHFGTNVNVLNAIGECYYQLGDAEEALYAWEKSLQIEPNQDKIKARVKALKEKKK